VRRAERNPVGELADGSLKLGEPIRPLLRRVGKNPVDLGLLLPVADQRLLLT
jgi:hypothetical protein